MAMTATAFGRFQIGRVFSNAFGTLGRNAGQLAAWALLLSMAPALVEGFFFQPTLAALQQLSPSAIFASPFYWLSVLINLVAFLLLQGAITYITVTDLDGRRPESTATVATALRRALPLLGVYILFGLGVAVGSLLLIVPGLILFVMWIVAGACVVVERTGIIASFGRSRALTKGSRWQIVGIFVVLLLANVVVIMVLAAITGGSAFALGRSQSFVVANAIYGAIATLFDAVVLGAIYVELRTVKEGASTTTLAAIFA